MDNKMEADVGVPIKIFRECEGHNIKIESRLGHLLEGKLESADDNMNCHISGVTMTKKNGIETKMDNLYISGTQITLVILPEALQNMFTFEYMESNRARRSVTGRGKVDLLSAQQAEERKRRRHVQERRDSSTPRHPKGASDHRSGDGGHHHGGTGRSHSHHDSCRHQEAYHDVSTCCHHDSRRHQEAYHDVSTCCHHDSRRHQEAYHDFSTCCHHDKHHRH